MTNSGPRYVKILAVVVGLPLLILLVLIGLQQWSGKTPSNTAYPNRSGTESQSAGRAAQGAGVGDVGGLRDHK